MSHASLLGAEFATGRVRDRVGGGIRAAAGHFPLLLRGLGRSRLDFHPEPSAHAPCTRTMFFTGTFCEKAGITVLIVHTVMRSVTLIALKNELDRMVIFVSSDL